MSVDDKLNVFCDLFVNIGLRADAYRRLKELISDAYDSGLQAGYERACEDAEEDKEQQEYIMLLQRVSNLERQFQKFTEIWNKHMLDQDEIGNDPRGVANEKT